ncbi:integral membrane protein [Colletotrichum graminicola]|nr:integral membrane protein [Colletotrichum graminicola]
MALRLDSTAEDLGFRVGDVLAMADFDPVIKTLDDVELDFSDATYRPEQPLWSPMDSNHHRISTVQNILQKVNHRAKILEGEDYAVTVFLSPTSFYSGPLYPDDRVLHHALLRVLVANGVDVSARDHLGRTMLWKDTVVGGLQRPRGRVLDNSNNKVLHHTVSQACCPGSRDSAEARM